MAIDSATMVVIDLDGYEGNYGLISSSHYIIFNKISELKNTVFLVSGATYTKILQHRSSAGSTIGSKTSLQRRVITGWYVFLTISIVGEE